MVSTGKGSKAALIAKPTVKRGLQSVERQKIPSQHCDHRHIKQGLVFVIPERECGACGAEGENKDKPGKYSG
jgi:hypothetical protein